MPYFVNVDEAGTFIDEIFSILPAGKYTDNTDHMSKMSAATAPAVFGGIALLGGYLLSLASQKDFQYTNGESS